MTKTNVQLTPSIPQHHDTPNNKTHVIKFRVTAEEKTSLELTCKLLNLSLSTFIRRAIHNVKIEKTVIVAGGGEETLTAVSTLLAQCSKVGTNLNQLARHFNSGGADTEQIRAKLLDELADLTAFRLSAEKVLGELYGNAQAYHDSLAVVKDLEGRMKANKELRYHVAAYASTKSVAQQLKTAKRPAAFEELHRAELTAYRAATAYFKANNITKLPSPKNLEAEYAQLASEKAKFYEQYKEIKEELLKLKTDPEFQSQIPPLTDDEFKQLEENILKEGKLISPLIVWNNTLVDGHNRYEIVQEHPEISFSTMSLPFESREEVLAWICKNQLGRRNLTPEQKKFLIGKQYSMEHRKPGGNGNNQHTAAAKKTAPEELCQIDTIPPTSAEASIRKQIAERNNVSESYVARSEKFMHGVEIMEQMVPGMQEKTLSGQFKVRDADMHRLAKAAYVNREQIVHEILYPEDRLASQSSYSHYSGINCSALEVAVRRIQQDFDFLMRYLPKLPDDSYAKTETLKILKQHKAYMAQYEEMLNDEKNRITTGTCKPSTSH